MAVPMFKLARASVGVARIIFPVPNAIDRVLVLLELNRPVVSVNVFSVRLPLVNVVVDAVLVVNASLNVVVPDTLLTVNELIVLPLLRMLPVPTVISVSPVNVPPDDNVKLPAMFNVVAGKAKAVDPKVRFLIKLVLVMVMIATPAPVNATLGALVASPAVDPVVSVLVMEASVVNPPDPVQVNPVAVAMLNTTVAAVV